MAQGMQDNSRPFTQYDDLISATQTDRDAGDDRPIQDNGTHATFSVGGMPSVSKVDYPLPRDPNAPPGYSEDSNQAEVNDYGLNESKEVGFNGGIHSYGLASGEVGAKDGNYEDQAFAPNGGGKGSPSELD